MFNTPDRSPSVWKCRMATCIIALGGCLYVCLDRFALNLNRLRIHVRSPTRAYIYTQASMEASAPAAPAPAPSLLSDPMLSGCFPLHETSDFTLVIRLRRIIEGNMRDLAACIVEHYKFWYHDQLDETSQARTTAPRIALSSPRRFNQAPQPTPPNP